MKKRITITESERERILNLHVTAKNRLSEQTALGTAVNAFQAQRLQNKSQRQQDRADATQAKANEFASQLPQQQAPPAAPQQQAPPAAPQQQAPPAAPQQQTPPPAEPRYKTATCSSAGKGPSCNDKVLRLQMLMNDKCPTNVLTVKLVEDGVIGGSNSKTNQALKVCDSYIRANAGPGAPSGTQSAPPANNQPSGQTNAPGAPAGSVSATSSGSSEQFDSQDV